ncbi:hypothetical protein [Algiphilus sp.]|uniref:phage tail tube protein n=1 Tax=Algiphilus sp. TaxID=1872431 RepID=UPI0025C26A56|nr:hypothetical protein [Algiphilus sp.]MCK5770936.1 hypothetical protein [Algiphilus sp.]
MSGLLCAGDLYLDRLDDNGNRTGYRKVGNATRFAINEPSERQQRTGRGRENYGQVLDDVAIKQPSTLAITLDEVDKTNLAYALLGDAAAYDVTGSSVTDEEITAHMGAATQLANRNIDDGTAVTATGEGGSPSFTEGTDFTIDYRLGLLTPIEGGAISDGDAVLVSYTFLDASGNRVSGGVKPQIRAVVMLDGKNLADGSDILVTVDEARITPDGEVDFLSSEFVPLPMTGTMRLLPGKTAPYTVDLPSAG